MKPKVRQTCKSATEDKAHFLLRYQLNQMLRDRLDMIFAIMNMMKSKGNFDAYILSQEMLFLLQTNQPSEEKHL